MPLGEISGMRPRQEVDEKEMRARPPRLRDRLGRALVAGLVGRERELSLLERQLASDGAVVTFVHGMGGIGKTALLGAAEPRLSAAGARVLRLDGRVIEPTPRGFLGAIARVLGAVTFDDVEALADELERDRATSVIVVDEFDRVRLLDDWLRQELLPALPERTRFIFAGRLAPRSAWLMSPGWSEAVISLKLDALADAPSRELLARRGVSDEAMPPLLSLARGVPLALSLVTPGRGRPPLQEEPNVSAVLAALAECSADDLRPELKEAVEAACLVRRTTRTMLEAMLGRACDDALFAELAELSFVEHAEDGLTLHETVRHALASRLRALDPTRCLDLRIAAWRKLEALLSDAVPTGPNAWQLTADVLFLVEHPEVREAFFPSHDEELVVESGEPTDHAAVFEIIERFESSELASVFEAWWELARPAFRVVRDSEGVIAGFVIATTADSVPRELEGLDPLLAAWLEDLRAGPGSERGALLVRRALSREHGEAASAVRAAIWLDIKRDYVAHPSQWALYAATRALDATLPLAKKLGFEDGELRHGEEETLRLEFGAAGIWSWLRRLVNATELGQANGSRASSSGPAGWTLDSAARGLVVDGEAVALSALEYHALTYLLDNAGSVVTRDTLLDEVWQQRHTGSNVVDAVVRLLRKKLGPYASELETVRGHGYRITRAPSR
jgi:hypothetical protein